MASTDSLNDKASRAVCKRVSETGKARRRSPPTARRSASTTCSTSGAGWWRLRYRIAGKEQMLSLGVYPVVTLSMARQRRDEAGR